MAKFLIFALVYVIIGWIISRSKVVERSMLKHYGNDMSSIPVVAWIVFILLGPILFLIGMVMGVVELVKGRSR